MGIWRKIGITEVSVDDLGDKAIREVLLGSRCPEAGTPLLLEPGSLDNLAAYLLELESPGRGGGGYAKLRSALLASAVELETVGGKRVIALAGPIDRFVRDRTSEFMRQDCRDLLTLGSQLGLAAQTLSGDGRVLTSASSAEASWARAADAVGSFLARPRRAGRFDLEDFFLSVDGVCALANCLELLRRLLLAAGRALNALGAATLGHHDLSGVGGAVDLWKISEGTAARRLAKSLAELASRTPGPSERGEVGCARPGTEDTAWIESCSQLGQDVLRWVYDRGQATLNFAGTVGVAWPGPGLYGYDDGEEEPGRARALCAALESRRDPEHPLLFGTHEATVSQDLVVPIPETLLEGADHLFLTESVEELGGLFCQTPPRHFAKLARLIDSEQRLWGHPWMRAGDYEGEFALYASGEEVAVLEGGLPLSEVGACGWARPGASVLLLGLGDHFEIVSAEHERERGIEPSELLQTYY